MTLNVVFAVDDRGFDMMAVAIYSVIKNNQRHKLNFFVFHKAISVKNITRLKKLEKEFTNVRINISTVDEDRFKDVDVTNKNVTTEAYFRYLAPERLIDEPRALCMDYDMLCLTDLEELYNTDLEDNYIGAVADYAVEHESYYRKFKKGIGLDEKDTYANSGLLLLDLKKIRGAGIMEQFWSNLKNKNKIIPKEFNIFADQTVTNLTFRGKIKFLDSKYNVFTTTLAETKQKNPVIVHFTGPYKPLTYRNDETATYDEIYYEYYDESRNIIGDNGGKFLKNTFKRLSRELVDANDKLQRKDDDVRAELEGVRRDLAKYRSEAEMWRHESARLSGELIELRRVVPLVKQLIKSLDATIRRRIEKLNKRKVRRIKGFSPSEDISRESLLLSVRKYDLDTYYMRTPQGDRLLYRIVMGLYDAFFKFTLAGLIGVYKLIRKVRSL